MKLNLNNETITWYDINKLNNNSFNMKNKNENKMKGGGCNRCWDESAKEEKRREQTRKKSVVLKRDK
jgi:hypothetical protein